MSVQLNHTIVWCRDQKISANFLREMLGLPAPSRFGPFLVVSLNNDISLDFYETEDEIMSQHYAFLVGDAEFEPIFERVRKRKLTYWADPGKEQKGKLNHRDGGKGFYFEDPDGHFLEILTRPYGSGG
jgi:catechol 2,3-dioxygenase-like lactoylglutathione lyase family enzyme